MLGLCCHLQDAQAQSAQLLLLQGQLDRSQAPVTDLGILHQKVTCLHADLGKLTKAKEVNAQVSRKTTVFDCFDLAVMMHQLFSRLQEIAMTTSDGLLIFTCSVVGSLLLAPVRV